MSAPEDAVRQRVGAGMAGIKPFPRIVLDVLAVLDDEDANANLLVEHIQRDPPLTGTLLGMANSPATRPSGQAVKGVATAVALLGFARVRALVTALALREAFAGAMPEEMESRFWGHSSDVATATKTIAEHAGLHPDIAFVAGLLHDIGILWIAVNAPDESVRIRALLEADHTIIDAERRVLGTDHAEIGRVMCAHWGLPEAIRQAVAGHHNPDALPPDPLMLAVHLAETACNALDLGGRARNVIGHVSEAALPALGLTWAAMPDLLGEIEARARFMRTLTGFAPA